MILFKGEKNPQKTVQYFFLLKVEQQVAKVFLFISLGMMLLKIMTLVAVRTQETALKYWFALI